MKFARYLDENTVPEWRKVYIQYRGLKKLIKQVAEHREARLRLQEELSLSRSNSNNTSAAKSPRTPIDPALCRRGQGSSGTDPDQNQEESPASATGYSRRFDYASAGTPSPALPPLPPVSLQGTGLRLETDPLPSNSPGFQTPPKKPSKAPTPDLEADPHTATADAPQSSTAKRNFGPAINTNVRFDSSASASASNKQHGSSSNNAPALSPITSFSPFTATTPKTPSALRFFDCANLAHRKDANPDKQRRLMRSASSISFRSKDDPPQSLAELIATCFDEEEAKVFSACNAELERIVAFYEAQEQEAAKKYAMLARQLAELAEHRREYRAKYGITSQDRTMPTTSKKNRVSTIFNPSVSKMIESGADEVAYKIKSVLGESQLNVANKAAADGGKARNESSDDDAGDKRRAKALAQMQASLRGWDEDTDEAIREANKAAAMSHDPEAYNAARKKLKAAVIEYYKFLDTLTNYKILNRTGFAKVMKKLSKTVGVPCADLYYQDKVAPTILVTSDRIEKLRKATEDIYAAYFEHGNRKQALDRLRAREDHTTHHYSVFRSGLYLGVSLCAIVDGLIEAMKPETKQAIPQWASLLRVYGAEFIPTLFALLFGLNLAWWHAVRINTVFIFEWDVRTTMDHRQFFEIPALLMLILSFCFWASFNSDAFPDRIAPTTWPTVWIVLAAIIMLNPFNLFMPASRWWFTKSLLRVFSAGYKRVEFRDFFLGDELNSVAWTISNFWYIGCEYHHNWAYPDQCRPNNTYWTAVLLSVPAWLRMGQCIRRWVDSDYKTHLHLVNAGKYTSAVVNNFIYIHWRRNGSLNGRDKALWILFASIYSIWHIGWDLIMDWSLLKPRAKYFLLRQEISFPQPVYYIFMVVDVIGRSAWITYLFPGRATVTLRSFLVALVEMLRRACWNMLRVENEQIGNTDSFKIMRDLPLPYRQKLREDAEAEQAKPGSGGGLLGSGKLATALGFGRKTDHPALGGGAAHGLSAGSLEHLATPPQAGGAGKKRRKSLLESVRNKLVPDARGTQYEGKRLDERAATKGQSGRDYTPRQPQGAAAFVDRDSDEDEDDEGEETTRYGRELGTGTESNSNSNDESSPKRQSTQLPSLSASTSPEAAHVEVNVSQDADDAASEQQRQRQA